MIDPRFQLVPSEYPHVFHLQFSVVLPPERYYSTQVGLITEEAKKQYPELDFERQGEYSARFADGQYARCKQCVVKNGYVEEIIFSMPLNLDSIMSATCSFKRAVPPIQFTVYPAELVDMTPEDFHGVIEDMYSDIGFCLRIRAVDWQIKHDSVSTYMIKPTDYNYV